MNFLILLAVALLQVRPVNPNVDTSPGAGGYFCGCVCPIIGLIGALISLVGTCKVFSKAGQPAWAALIPIYNTYVLCQIIKKPDWFVWTFIPCVNFYFGAMICIETARVFGQGTGFGLGLLFLAPIFWPILGLGSAEYEGGRRRRRRARDEEDEDEDEDDRPRRRRPRDEEEEEEERPRRPARPARPRDEDDEEEERPRRPPPKPARPRDEDDEDRPRPKRRPPRDEDDD